jgi:hypothetical protein
MEKRLVPFAEQSAFHLWLKANFATALAVPQNGC